MGERGESRRSVGLSVRTEAELGSTIDYPPDTWFIFVIKWTKESMD